MAMIETTTTVVKVEGNTVWLARGHDSACGSCGQKQGCSTWALANLFGNKTVRADCHFYLQVGDRVLVEIEEHVVLRGAALLYALPLLGLFGAVLVADRLILPKDLPMRELWLTGSAVLGLLYSFVYVSRIKQGSVKPVVVRKIT